MNIKIPVIPIGSYSADLKTKSKSIGINTSVIEVVVEVIFNIETIVPLNKQTNTIQNEFLLSSIVIQGEVPNYYYASDSNESFPYVPCPEASSNDRYSAFPLRNSRSSRVPVPAFL